MHKSEILSHIAGAEMYILFSNRLYTIQHISLQSF